VCGRQSVSVAGECGVAKRRRNASSAESDTLDYYTIHDGSVNSASSYNLWRYAHVCVYIPYSRPEG